MNHRFKVESKTDTCNWWLDLGTYESLHEAEIAEDVAKKLGVRQWNVRITLVEVEK